MSRVWDYIIVGAGSAGCLLANRLTGAGHSVLLVEAGGQDRGFWLRLPVGYFKTIFNERYARQFKTEPQPETGNREILWPRGRILGGSSSINGLIYIRGQHQDYDDWAVGGASGWHYQEVLPYFKKSECYAGPESPYHGKDGELGVSDLRNRDPSCMAWLDAAQEYGLPFNPDFNASSEYGVGSYQLSIKGRWRSSASAAFLNPILSRQKLTVFTNTLVSRVIFEGRQAVGIECLVDGMTQRLRAEQEVIISAGAIQSPQILQLSGIGPVDLLSRLNIPVVHDAPEVGRNLQDHYQVRTIVRLKDPISLNDQVRSSYSLLKMGLEWLFAERGPLTVGAGQVGGFAKTSLAENDRTDIQFNVMPLSVDKPGDPLHEYSGFTVSVCQCRPLSRGSIEIVSSDPKDSPRIQPNYLVEQKDSQILIEGLEICRAIYSQKSFRSRWVEEVLPGDVTLREFARMKGGTVFHPTSTCRMGGDDLSVVDPQLRVRGVERLRVIDASVMPSVVSANTNAATIMIAEKGADILISESVG